MTQWYRKERWWDSWYNATRTTATLCRWTQSCTIRAHIAGLTSKMFHIANNDQVLCNESNPSRGLRDDSDEKKIVALPHQANVFNVNNQATIPERLQNMTVTIDVATTSIEESLLDANSPGQEELIFQPFMRSKRTILKRVRPSKTTETPISALLQHTMPAKE